MQQIISKGGVKIKELFSDLFKPRNAVSLKKNPSKKMEIPGGWRGGGSTNDPLEGKFQGGGGYGYFLEPHIN